MGASPKLVGAPPKLVGVRVGALMGAVPKLVGGLVGSVLNQYYYDDGWMGGRGSNAAWKPQPTMNILSQNVLILHCPHCPNMP